MKYLLYNKGNYELAFHDLVPRIKYNQGINTPKKQPLELGATFLSGPGLYGSISPNIKIYVEKTGIFRKKTIVDIIGFDSMELMANYAYAKKQKIRVL